MSSLGMLALVMMSDLDRVEIVNDDDGGRNGDNGGGGNGGSSTLAPSDGAPSIGMLSLSVSRN